ncbi:MAG: hypothetical protein PHE55_05095 [Methylococcaceae bacterium]|nr:hypothetical protein [Methylococcaceae bacterium]
MTKPAKVLIWLILTMLLLGFWKCCALFGQVVPTSLVRGDIVVLPGSGGVWREVPGTRVPVPLQSSPKAMIRPSDFLISHSLVTKEKPDSPGFSWKLALVDGGVTTADFVTTRMILARGGQESWSAWYYGRHPSAARGGLQIAAWYIGSQLLAKWFDLRGHHRLARTIQWLKIGGESFAVINNAVVLRK